MGWDYDKLFAEGNIIGVKYFNSVGNHVVKQKKCWGLNFVDDWEIFCNDELKAGLAIIEYIIRLDENGNVIERLFDRDKDEIEYPELNVGTFGKIMYFNGKSFEEVCRSFGQFVIAKNGYISYKNGGYDRVSTILEFKNDRIGPKIVELYDANFFDECDNANLIWRNPMYESWLKKKEEE